MTDEKGGRVMWILSPDERANGELLGRIDVVSIGKGDKAPLVFESWVKAKGEQGRVYVPVAPLAEPLRAVEVPKIETQQVELFPGVMESGRMVEGGNGGTF